MTKRVLMILIIVALFVGERTRAATDSLGLVYKVSLFEPASSGLKHQLSIYKKQQPDVIAMASKLVLNIYTSDTAKACLYHDTFATAQVLQQSDDLVNSYTLPVRSEALALSHRDFVMRYRQLPVGIYTLELLLEDSLGTPLSEQKQYLAVDSALLPSNKIYKKFDAYYSRQKGLNLNNQDRLIERYFSKESERVETREHEGMKNLWVYQDAYLIGIMSVEQLEDGRNDLLPSLQPGNFVSGNRFSDIITAAKEKNRLKQEEQAINGNVLMQYNYSNQQEAYSGLQNSYYDIGGTVTLPVMGIPIMIDGYYTQQDRNRVLKSSYLHVSFDKDALTEQLEEMNKELKRSYTDGTAGITTYEHYYKQLLSRLNSEKAQYLSELQHLAKDTLSSVSDTVGHYGETAITAYEEGVARYDELTKQIAALETKIRYAETTIEQISNKKYIDSVEVYTKIKREQLGDMDSEDYLNVLEQTFPKNKMVSKLRHLNKLSVGSFSNQVSKYTNPGQMMKGGSVSYDLGYLDVGVSLGRVDLVDFGGNKERINVGSIELRTRKIKNQEIGFIYQHSAPAGTDTFLAAVSASEEANRSLSQGIYTVLYNLNLPFLELATEGAYSNGSSGTYRSEGSFSEGYAAMMDKTSFNIVTGIKMMEGKITLGGMFEHIGRSFNNNILYYNMRGVQTYNAQLSSFWLKDQVKIDLSYHVLSNIRSYGSGNNKRYGFDVQTLSKRFPKIRISYKPYTSFNTISDTVTNFSYTLMGNVFLTRLDYKYKRKKMILNTGLHYNRSNSLLDTVSYSSDVLTLHTSLIYDRLFANLTIGRSYINSNIINADQLLMNNNTFSMIQLSYPVLPLLTIGGGINLGWNEGTMTKYGGKITVRVTHKKTRASLFVNTYYTQYNIANNWEQIYNIATGVQIPFHFQLK